MTSSIWTSRTRKTTLAALALTASVGLALPAAAGTMDRDSGSHHARGHHASSSHGHHPAHTAYRDGYMHGFHDGHYARIGPVGEDVGPYREDGVETGRSVAIDPYDGGPIEEDGFGHDGVLGTGVLDGRGALGIGVLGF